MTHTTEPPWGSEAPVCMSVADLTVWTRSAGYGTPLDLNGDAA